MTLHYQYIHSLILVVLNNKILFTLNNETHMYNTRNNNLHLPLVHLTKFSKVPYITGIKVFNHLPQNLKTLVHDSRKFYVL